jgi:hypothetical protein
MHLEEARNYVDVHYNKWKRRYEERIEREKKIRQRKEEEEKARKKPSEVSSAKVEEITAEEYERSQREQAEKDKKKPAGPEEPPKPKEEAKKDKKEEDDGDKLQEGHVMPNKEKGATLAKYSWGQMAIEEITMSAILPGNIRGKDMKIEYDNNHLYVGIKGQEPIINDDLHAAMKSDTLVWSLEEVKQGKLLNITFEKAVHTWWECVEKKDTVLVDTRKISPEASKLSDIDDPELKAQVEKMMFDQRQKQMGKPTSDILQKCPQIEDFMRQHPEMDFSKTNFC